MLLACLAINLPAQTLCQSEEIQEPVDAPQFYFWNELTGETQWDDPGDVPFEDAHGNRYWLGPNGERLENDPQSHRYSWVEGWSAEHKRPFYYNQETKESTWDRPPDLAWRRVPYKDEL
ncbi:hypothetical protein WJX72_008973 [[Myrmecia] bisecta]|uniref:WW domain-containing protein n=1 Tax=[Myrmecia] bisecta TaxID=41462 RepID=A0AAW1PWW8_9CHLO